MSNLSPELTRGNIIMSRVRLARNIKGLPFFIQDEHTAKSIIQKVNRAIVKCGTFNLYTMSSADKLTLESMKERHLISQNLIENKENGAVLINTDESISIMLFEEDIIREQCFMSGLNLNSAYKKLSVIDDEISKNIDLAFDERLGYLTTCLTNVGTGLRSSVMMFLPALTESGKIKTLIREVEQLGLTVRGLYGEGSSAEGYMYQISNETTLGVSEYDILTTVEDTVEDICSAERELMEELYCGKNELKTMDRARKAFGILTSAVLLDYNEFLRYIAQVKLGAMLGVIDINNVEGIDDLITDVRPASLCVSYGKRLSASDRDLVRAKIVGDKLLKLKE